MNKAEQLAALLSKFVGELKPAERTALHQWKDYSHELQSNLRNGGGTGHPVVSRMDELLKRSPWRADSDTPALYRGMDPALLKEGAYPSYMSVTPDQNMAEHFAGMDPGGNGSVMRILPGEGTPYLNIDQIPGVGSANGNEMEYVLPRGGQLRKHETDPNTWIYDMINKYCRGGYVTR